MKCSVSNRFNKLVKAKISEVLLILEKLSILKQRSSQTLTKFLDKTSRLYVYHLVPKLT